MPHATEDPRDASDLLADALNEAQTGVEVDEDDDFRRAMNALSGGGTRDEDLARLLQGEGEIGAGEEKADDAQDFEDISDDDLPEEEGDAAPPAAQAVAGGEDEPDELEDLFGGPAEDTVQPKDDQLMDDDDDDLDALFQDDAGSPPPSTGPTEVVPSQSLPQNQINGSFGSTTVADTSFEQTQTLDSSKEADEASQQSEEDDDLENDPQYQLQQRLLKGMGPTLVNDDTFAELWPQYQPDRPLRFNQMFIPKNSYYPGKVPLKPPKPLLPGKVTLEIQGDHEKKFKLTGSTHANYEAMLVSADERGMIMAMDQKPVTSEKAEEESLEDLADDENDVGQYHWHDLVAVCQDWEMASQPGSEPQTDAMDVDNDSDDAFRLLDEIDPVETETRKNFRKRKAESSNITFATPIQLLNAYIDAPESATAHLAKRVRLDLNDPHLLVEVRDDAQPVVKKRKTAGTFKRDATGGLTRDFDRRYNISNDAEYEMLKKNHHGKVRAALGGNTVEHAMPALRLQYPYYKVKMSSHEARSFHRPNLSFPYTANSFAIRKNGIKKKRDIKGKSAPEIFMNSQDLSLGDNSNMLLLEYSEEYPHILSGFGMGSKLLNYYRRPDDNDTQRPKQELGELSILMGQDRSPFQPFGEIQKGEMVPTIVNAMYKAPIFKHEPNETDFVAACSRTGTHGRRWYLRKVENLHVVAQEFPSMEVPGTHSRKVTDAAKRRLRRLAWRMLKKYGKVKNEPLLKHLPNTDLAQNRSKMREIMDYDKDRGWVPKKTDVIPDDDTIRGWIAPEDICLLDSMQVGDQQLRDAGYNKGDEDDEDEITDEAAAGQSIDQQLAPWNTTKNFINASQMKAMIAVVGEGDPSGRGEAFSFIRTSMKGGFKDPEESIDKKLESKRRKEGSGHQYNVADQHKAYTEALARVWNAQKASLSSTTIPEDDADVDMEGASEVRPNGAARTASVAPAVSGGDDSMSMFSKTSTSSQTGKVMRIRRTYHNKHTGQQVTNVEVIRDATVWKEYQRRRIAKAVSQGVSKLAPTGNPEIDRVQQKILIAEINRLKKNHNRTTARDRSKGILPDGDDEGGADSPADGAPSGKPKRDKFAPTLRRCNNCGQVGHIRTNKKLCPILNGSIQTAPAAGDSAFGSINPAAGGDADTPVADDGAGEGEAA